MVVHCNDLVSFDLRLFIFVSHSIAVDGRRLDELMQDFIRVLETIDAWPTRGVCERATVYKRVANKRRVSLAHRPQRPVDLGVFISARLRSSCARTTRNTQKPGSRNRPICDKFQARQAEKKAPGHYLPKLKNHHIHSATHNCGTHNCNTIATNMRHTAQLVGISRSMNHRSVS